MGWEQSEFAEFYATNRDWCLRAVLISVGDLGLAEDLTAEGFARAWARWRRVREHPTPSAWVVRTALNLRVSWWRRRRREVVLTGHDVAQDAERSGLDVGLLTALRRLPVRQREVLALRILLDLDTAATGQVLGIAPGTVTAHLSRALATLRSQLVSTDPGEVRS